jgi:erythromycin esterase-like protein
VSFLSLLLAAALPAAQDTVLSPADVRAAATVVRSIDIADDEFRDLQHLKKDLAAARVVVLGESHIEGATIAAKGRLIRFLHEEMGFDVLVAEHDLLGVREDMRQLKAGASFDQLMGPIGVSRSAERAALWSYVVERARGRRPLEVVGMDPSYFVGRPSTQLGPDLLAFFDSAGPTLLPGDLRTFLQGRLGYPYMSAYREMTPGRYSPPMPADSATVAKRRDEEVLRALLGLIVRHRPALERAHGRNEVRFMEQGLENRVLHLTLVEDRQRQLRSDAVFSARDSLMARTVAFMMNDYYKGRKIIVSSGSHHAMRNGTELGVAGFENLTERLHRSMPGRVYSVGFVAHEGRAGSSPAYPIPIQPTRPGSLEWAASQTDAEFLWIDLGRLPGTYRSKLFVSQPLAAWKRHFDYVFYIRRQRTLTPR